jgi:hypothetical protein
MPLLVIYASSLSGALSIIVFFKIIDNFVKNKKMKLFLTITYAILIIPYSTVFFSHILALLLALISFYLILKEKTKYLFFSGIFAGLSIFTDYTEVILISFYFLFLIFTSRRKIHLFILGGLIGIFPLIIYNFLATGNPLKPPFLFYDREIWPISNMERVTTASRLAEIIAILPQIMVLPYRGLFIYFPILALSILGLFFGWKRNKKMTIFIFALFAAYIIANLLLPVPYGGADFAPRYLIPTFPFLIISLGFALEKFKGKIFWLFVCILFVITIFNVAISFQPWEGMSFIFNKTTDNYTGIQNFDNPLYEHYLPLTMKTGPRSHIIEDLITNPAKIDIRDTQLQPTSGIKFITTPFGFLTLRLQVLPITLIILIIFLIWRKEIFQLIPKDYHYLLYVILFVIIASTLDLHTINYGENWYPIYKNETYTDPYRWMNQNGTLYLFSLEKTEAILSFSFIAYKNQTFDIILNNEKINTYSSNLTSMLKDTIHLNRGENVLMLNSKEGCHVPKEWEDVRCLSIATSDIKVFTEKS